MINRKQKMVSLLMAGASILSTMPTMAVHAATDIVRLESQEGEISKAIAFDGKYLYEGYKGDEDTSLYYFNGTKDEVAECDGDELDDSEIVRKYGSQYVVLDDEDEYLLDLSTGKVSDENTASDALDDAVTKLKKQHKKADRYEDYTLDEDLKEIPSKSFSKDVYYMYKYTDSNSNDVLFGFTDKSGKYVDVSNDANIYFYNGSKAVKIKEYSDADTTKAETAVLKNIQPISQDDSYIYAIATVDINVSVNEDGTVNKITNQYLQKIAKKQGSKENDAYLPSSTVSYLLTKDCNESDVKNAYDLILDSNGEVNSDITLTSFDGKLVVTSFDGSAVTVTTLDTKNTKVTPIVKQEDGSTSKADKVNMYAVAVNDDDDQDAEDYCFDIDGNTWVINKGKIYKSEKGKDFEQVFKCDSSFDKIDVYNSENLIVWGENEDEFAVLCGGSTNKEEVVDKEDETVKEEEVVTKKYTIGWNLIEGKWFYSLDGQDTVKGNWLNDKGTWYYLNADGSMATGWLQQNGTWYFLNDNGSMATGWKQVGGTWYYLNANGSMKTGWLDDNGTWYYLNADGSMAHDTVIGSYKLGSNGAWIR